MEIGVYFILSTCSFSYLQLDPSAVMRSAPPAQSPVSLGDIYYCQIAEIKSQALAVRLYKARSAEGVAIAEATLPFTHISDSASIARLARLSSSACFQPMAMLSLSREGATEPTRVVVIGITATEVVVSAKPSLVTAAEQNGIASKSYGFVCSFEQLKVS